MNRNLWKDRGKPMGHKSRGSRLRGILIGLLAVMFLVSGGMTVHSHMEAERTRKEDNRLAELARETTAALATEACRGTETLAETKPYVSPIDFRELDRKNPETVGWLRMPGTRIDYPIVQSRDNDFYLSHGFDREKSAGGAIFLDYESQGDFVGRNNIIYGHNMKNGSMFKDLVRFKDEAFFRAHQYFTIDTPTREIRLKAVACYYGEAKPLVRKTRFKSQESFDAFVREMTEPCAFGEKAAYPARTLYTLVTCSYEINDGRTFLFAVEVDKDGRETGPDQSFLKKMEGLMGKTP